MSSTRLSELSQFARTPDPQPHPCDLIELVHQCVVLYRETDPEQAVLVEELEDGLGLLRLDANKMTQVLQNLLKNAIQATQVVDRPGRVRVTTRARSDGEVEPLVEDNGCGIPEGDLPRVFTPTSPARRAAPASVWPSRT